MQGMTPAGPRLWAIACVATCAIMNVLSQEPPSSTPDAKQAMEYLEKYGYISEARSRAEPNMKTAISEFQRMAGLEATGSLDKDTMAKMAEPRCGVGDTARDRTFAWHAHASRTRRYILTGSRWRKTTLMYHFLNLTPDLKGSEVKKIIARAFRDWSRVTPLRFVETPSPSRADINIQFSRLEHGDNVPFDGPGRVLAHAFFPEDGRAHFDEDEQWTEGSSQGINLRIVAAHEFGHLLGLSHSKEQASLMAPFYRGYSPSFRLHADDIAGIQRLYGRSASQSQGDDEADDDKTPPPTRSPKPRDVPDPCKAPLDAITMGPDDRTYAFSGAHCWVVTDTGVQQGHPVATSSLWPGLPADISAAVHSKRTGRTYFFAGNKYWRYNGFASDPGYPKMLSSTGLPSNVDAAMLFGSNVYVFKGDEYWMWDELRERAARGYPRKIAAAWRGVPSPLDAALTWRNGRSFFFKDGRYWRINSRSRRTEASYPRNTAAVWMGCTRPSLKQHAVAWDDVGAQEGFGVDRFHPQGRKERPEIDDGYGDAYEFAFD